MWCYCSHYFPPHYKFACMFNFHMLVTWFSIWFIYFNILIVHICMLFGFIFLVFFPPWSIYFHVIHVLIFYMWFIQMNYLFLHIGFILHTFMLLCSTWFSHSSFILKFSTCRTFGFIFLRNAMQMMSCILEFTHAIAVHNMVKWTSTCFFLLCCHTLHVTSQTCHMKSLWCDVSRENRDCSSKLFGQNNNKKPSQLCFSIRPVSYLIVAFRDRLLNLSGGL